MENLYIALGNRLFPHRWYLAGFGTLSGLVCLGIFGTAVLRGTQPPLAVMLAMLGFLWGWGLFMLPALFHAHVPDSRWSPTKLLSRYEKGGRGLRRIYFLFILTVWYGMLLLSSAALVSSCLVG